MEQKQSRFYLQSLTDEKNTEQLCFVTSEEDLPSIVDRGEQSCVLKISMDIDSSFRYEMELHVMLIVCRLAKKLNCLLLC